MEINLPHHYEPREYQLPILQAFDNGYKRILQLWHRRSGKDKTDINLVAREMALNIGTYYYFYPTYTQGRKALWDGMGKDGFKYIEHFPKELIDGKPNDTEMKLKYKNGSLFQVIGTDDVDRIVGTNPRGCVFSEYSLQNPKGWNYIRPILAENKGWAIFNYTPRGKNHGWEIYEIAKTNPKWFVSKLTVDDTHVLTKEDIDEERASGMTEDMIQQEYYCSFTAAIQGAYYWKEYDKAEKEHRFTNVPYDDALPVYTVWDLGISDAMSIGFFQIVGKEIHMIDYYEKSNEGFPHFAHVLQERGYTYGKHFMPHDVRARELATGKTRLETAESHLGKDKISVVPNIGVQDGIDAGRSMFNRLWVDSTKCREWITLIPQYTKEYDEERKIFKNSPLHDWTSHGADMYRYAAIVIDKMTNEKGMAKHFRPSGMSANRGYKSPIK